MNQPAEPGWYWILYTLEVAPEPQVARWDGSNFLTAMAANCHIVPASDVRVLQGPLTPPQIQTNG
jgi:hypothetical protein